jgi:hypothetical protein
MPGAGGGPRFRSSFRMDPRTVRNVKKKMQQSTQRILNAAAKILKKEAILIKKESQILVPYDTGNLHDSAHYKVIRRKYSVYADIWYDADKAPYSWIQHEDETIPHDAPTRAKFLLIPLMAREARMEEVWAEIFDKSGVFK